MWRAAASLAVLLAVLLPPKLWRAGLEETIWLDETYSLVLTTHPVPDLVRRTLDDAHPPLYYLALKAWLHLARLAGAEPGILWARSLNLVLWALAAAAALAAGRRWLGPGAGTLFAWTVAGGAAAAQVAHDARSYGVAFPALVVCYLILIERTARPPDRSHPSRLQLPSPPLPRRPSSSRSRRPEPEPAERSTGSPPHPLDPLPTLEGGRRRLHPSTREAARAPVAWAVYAVAGAAALWSHLLSGVVLAALGAVWLGLALADRHRRPRRLAGFLGAQLGLLVLFLPWLARVPHQWALIQEAAPAWMTPATARNLLYTFVHWLPFGRLGAPDAPPFRAWLPLGVATVALPLLAAAAGALRAGRGRPAPAGGGPEDRSARRTLRAAAALGVGGAVLSVLALWALDRAGLAHVFHGPRYPLLAAGPWAGGLAALALSAVRGRIAIAWALVAPWLLAGLVGQLWAGRLESRGGLGSVLTSSGVSEVYVTPPELLPFFRGELRGVRAHRIEALPCRALERPAVARRATVADLNPWPAVERPTERLARRLIAERRLAARVRTEVASPGQLQATLYRLEDLRPAWCRSLCRTGFRLAEAPVPEGAPAAALPAAQRRADGWGDLELGPELLPYRWGVAEAAVLRFEGGLAPGRYRLHLVGAREPFPQAEVRLEGALASGAGRFAAPLGPGPFHLALPLALDAPLDDPALVLRHPLWSPAERLGSDDPRRLSFRLDAGWFEALPAPSGGAAGPAPRTVY